MPMVATHVTSIHSTLNIQYSAPAAHFNHLWGTTLRKRSKLELYPLPKVPRSIHRQEDPPPVVLHPHLLTDLLEH